MEVRNTHHWFRDHSPLQIEADGTVAESQRDIDGLFCYQGVGPEHLKVELRDGFTITEIRQEVVNAVCATPITERLHFLVPIRCQCEGGIVGYQRFFSYPKMMGEAFACFAGYEQGKEGIFFYEHPDSILLAVEDAVPITHMVHMRECSLREIPEYVDFTSGERYISFEYYR